MSEMHPCTFLSLFIADHAMTHVSRSLSSSLHSCFSAFLLAILLVLTGCDAGVVIDPQPTDPAATVASSGL